MAAPNEKHERPVGRDEFFASLGGRAWTVFGAAVFCMFAPLWAILTAEMVVPGRLLAFAIWCVFAGVVAVLYFLSFTRSRGFLPIAIVASVAIGVGGWFAESSGRIPWLGPGIGAPVPTPEGVIAVALIVAAYGLLLIFLSTVGASHVRMRTEMDVAQRIHAQIVPPVSLAAQGVRVVGRSEASGEMGGDVLDVIVRGDVLDVFLGDVTGHGVRAGTVMAIAKGAIHTRARTDGSLAEIMADLNAVLCDLTAGDMFLTMAALRIDGRAGRCEHVVAGHPPPIVLRAGGGLERIEPGSLPLGVDPGERFESALLTLGVGDRIVLFTDGLAEVSRRNGLQLGFTGLGEIVTRHGGLVPEALLDAVLRDVRAIGLPSDDQTLAVVDVVGVGAT